ncbi:MAG: glycosyltransferase family 4 protein [Bacteroidota bacterium]
MSLKFVTIFPEARNVHLRKGLGKIPFVLHRDFGYDARMVCFENESVYPSLENDVPGLKLEFFKHKNQGHPLWATILYLIANARDIDVLNIYGQSRFSFFAGLLYKLLKPDGILFLKLDMNIEYLHRLSKSKNRRRHLWFWNFYFRKIVSIVSSEYQELTQALMDFYTIDAHKIIQLPNGIDDIAIGRLAFKRKSFEQKEPIILVVGRIGAPEKNHEMILSAAQKLKFRDWKIVFVGPVEASFKPKVEIVFRNKPELSEQIEFVGEVVDFDVLCSWYNRAKIFCISSLREGFPVVLPEAMYWGDYIVSTRVSSINEILNEGELGTLVTNEAELLCALQELIDEPEKMKEKIKFSIQKAEEQYIWSGLVKSLAEKISKLRLK